jgi:O-antigen/teichoic acid export membrane protein
VTRQRLAGNMASMIAWQIASYVIPLLTFPYLTRVLDLKGYGEFAFSFSLVTYISLITDWGFSLSASGEIARSAGDRERITYIFWHTLLAKCALLGACLLALGLAVLSVPMLRGMAPVLAAASLLAVANALTVNWCLQGLERLGAFATAAMIGRALTVPATFLFVHDRGDAWIAALVQSGGGLAAAAISMLLLLRTHAVARPMISLAGVTGQLRDGWHLFLSTAAVNLYTTTNAAVLGFLAGPAGLAPYSAADRLRAAAQGVIQPISQAVYPHSNRLMAQDRAAGFRFARKLLLWQGLFTLVVSLVLLAGAPLIVRILAGPRFEAAVPILRVLAFIPMLVGISNVLGVQVMLPLGHKAPFSRILTGAAVVNLILVLPLTWAFGAMGTAAGTLAAEIFVVAAMLRALVRLDLPLLRTSGAAS